MVPVLMQFYEVASTSAKCCFVSALYACWKHFQSINSLFIKPVVFIKRVVLMNDHLTLYVHEKCMRVVLMSDFVYYISNMACS